MFSRRRESHRVWIAFCFWSCVAALRCDCGHSVEAHTHAHTHTRRGCEFPTSRLCDGAPRQQQQTEVHRKQEKSRDDATSPHPPPNPHPPHRQESVSCVAAGEICSRC